MTDVAARACMPDAVPPNWLYRRFPRPRLAAPSHASRPKRILVFIKGRNASFDYYLAARLRALGRPCEVRCIDRDGLKEIDPDGLLVIVCRYLGLRQVDWIRRHRSRLAGLAYFVDDDIAALASDGRNDLAYRLFLSAFACPTLMALEMTHLFVSTSGLARALGNAAAQVLPPCPIIEDHRPLDRSPSDANLKIVYHATRSHSREHEFLVPIMEAVMRLRTHVQFEVVARDGSARLWRRARIAPERIRIVPPMAWPDYHRHSRDHGADIALMPLVAGLANESRSDAKLIDCFRMGAAAILSDVAPYWRNRGSGLFMVGNTPEKWIDGLLRLIDNPALRSAAREATRARVHSMSREASNLPGILATEKRELAS